MKLHPALTPGVGDGDWDALHLDPVDADGLHGLRGRRQLWRVQRQHAARRGNLGQRPLLPATCRRPLVGGDRRRRLRRSGGHHRAGGGGRRGDGVLELDGLPLSGRRFEEDLRVGVAVQEELEDLGGGSKGERGGYLCWRGLCRGDLQAGWRRLALRDRRQRGRGRLHHLQGLLGDLDHLGLRFGLHHLDLLHYGRLAGTLHDQQVVSSLRAHTHIHTQGQHHKTLVGFFFANLHIYKNVNVRAEKGF